VRRFTVTGTGRFPLDMLRYDSCWPATQDDVRRLDHWQEMTGGAPRSVLMESANEPTRDRWSSFGWTVQLAD
jgi:hypothetical protein